MKTTDSDPRDQKIAELEQLLALATTTRAQREDLDKRILENRHETEERLWRDMTDAERVKTFATISDGDRRRFLQVVSSFCPGGVVQLCKAADRRTRVLIVRSYPDKTARMDLTIALLRDDQIPRWIAITGSMASTSECMVSPEDAAILLAAGVPLDKPLRIGGDYFYRGFSFHGNALVRFVLEDAFKAQCEFDTALGDLVTLGQVSYQRQPITFCRAQMRQAIEDGRLPMPEI